MADLTVTSEEMPQWLTLDFFRELQLFSNNFKLKSVQHACAKGDNFASKIYRVEFIFDDDTTSSLIVKSRPCGSGFSDEFVKKFNVFPKEIEMYENITLFEKLFHASGCDVTFAPK